MVRRAANGRCLVDMSYSAGSRCDLKARTAWAYSHILREASASLLVPPYRAFQSLKMWDGQASTALTLFLLPDQSHPFFQWQGL